MALFESGVTSYTWGQAIISVPFPFQEVCCENCRYFSNYSNRCGLNHDAIIWKPREFVGDGCPLQLIREEERDG